MFAEFLNNVILYPFFMVFIRLNGIFLTVPFYADKSISAVFRMALALVLALALSPIVSKYVISPPDSLSLLVGVILSELLIGILLGISAKFFMAAVNVAADFMSMLMGLQSSSMLDPSTGANSPTLGKLLSLMALAAFLALNLHLVMIEAFVQSYDVIHFNTSLDMGEVVYALIETVTKIMLLGIKMAAPVVIINFLVNIALGILNRLVPQIQVFFISMPLTMLVGLFVLVLSIASMLILFTEEISNNLVLFAQELE